MDEVKAAKAAIRARGEGWKLAPDMGADFVCYATALELLAGVDNIRKSFGQDRTSLAKIVADGKGWANVECKSGRAVGGSETGHYIGIVLSGRRITLTIPSPGLNSAGALAKEQLRDVWITRARPLVAAIQPLLKPQAPPSTQDAKVAERLAQAERDQHARLMSDHEFALRLAAELNR